MTQQHPTAPFEQVIIRISCVSKNLLIPSPGLAIRQSGRIPYWLREVSRYLDAVLPLPTITVDLGVSQPSLGGLEGSEAVFLCLGQNDIRRSKTVNKLRQVNSFNSWARMSSSQSLSRQHR